MGKTVIASLWSKYYGPLEKSNLFDNARELGECDLHENYSNEESLLERTQEEVLTRSTYLRLRIYLRMKTGIV